MPGSGAIFEEYASFYFVSIFLSGSAKYCGNFREKPADSGLLTEVFLATVNRAVDAMIRAIIAASGARGRTSCKRQCGEGVETQRITRRW